VKVRRDSAGDMRMTVHIPVVAEQSRGYGIAEVRRMNRQIAGRERAPC
jgi:hypothetical protein